MHMRGILGIFLAAFLVEASEKKPVGDEFWEAAKAIRAAEVVLQEAVHSSEQTGAKDAEVAVVDAATQLLQVTENVVKELRGNTAPAASKKKKLALMRQLNHMGRTLRVRRKQHHRYRLSALQDFNTALKSIRKAISEVKIAAWDAERRGVDSAARAAAVVVADEARRLFHLTQNMQHEEHKAVAVHNTVAKVAAAIDANLSTWSKVSRKHCRHHKLDSVGSHYGSLASAKQACEVRDNCAGIYQSGCSGFHFYLCSKDYAFEDSGTSCVYHKPSIEVPVQGSVQEQAVPEDVEQKPAVRTLAAKAVAAQALAAQAKKESDRLMDEAVAEVATAARNAEEVANTVYGKANPSVAESVLEVEKASEGLKRAVLASRGSRASRDTKVQLNNATEDSTPAAPTTTTTTSTTTTTTTSVEEMVAKVDQAFDKLEASFEPVGKTESQESAEGVAEQDLERLVGGAKEAPITRAFTIQRREEEREKEQAKEQQAEKANERVEIDAMLHDSAEASAPSVPHHHNLTPTDFKMFNAPDSTDAELEAAFEPLSKEPEPTAQEEHDRLQTVAAAAAKAAEDARKEAEATMHEQINVERPHRRFRPATPEVEPVDSMFKPEVEAAAGIEVPENQLAFEKAVGMTVEPVVKDDDQDEEAKHWRNVRKHHKHKHKKHHHSHW